MSITGIVTQRALSLRLKPPFELGGGPSFAAMERAMQELILCGSLAGWTDPDVEVLAALGWTATKLWPR